MAYDIYLSLRLRKIRFIHFIRERERHICHEVNVRLIFRTYKHLFNKFNLFTLSEVPRVIFSGKALALEFGGGLNDGEAFSL